MTFNVGDKVVLNTEQINAYAYTFAQKHLIPGKIYTVEEGNHEDDFGWIVLKEAPRNPNTSDGKFYFLPKGLKKIVNNKIKITLT
jgi:hypothetical protein